MFNKIEPMEGQDLLKEINILIECHGMCGNQKSVIRLGGLDEKDRDVQA